MNAKIQDWCTRTWTLAYSLPAGVGDDMRNRWAAHANRNELVLTLFGPYDSGKSSLLVRLLVEEGASIPDWLTVSGLRETFEIREAALLGVMIRDTPGIAGGNELHEQSAKDALLLTDIIALVLPPQLVTSDRDMVISVLNGERFNCPPNIAYLSHSLLVILSRMDEAGAMPLDDMDGYRALITLKYNELGNLLHTEDIAEDLVVVHAVAADPFGLVGNSVPSGADEYDAYRGWDGVTALADSIRYLGLRKSELRLRCEARFLATELAAVAGILDKMDIETRTATKAAVNEAKSYALVQDRIKALLRSARADLNRRIEEEVSASIRRSPTDVEELRTIVIERLEGTLDSWANEHDVALEALIQEADAEMSVRRARPAWENLSKVLFLGISREDIDIGKDSRQVIESVQHLVSVLHKGFREIQPAILGMPLEKASEELLRLSQAGSFKVYVKQTVRGNNRLRDTMQAAHARRAVLLDTTLDVAIPAMFELFGLISEAWVEQKVVHQRAERRKEVRHIVEEASNLLAKNAWDLWCNEGIPEMVEKAFEEAHANVGRIAVVLEAESKCISAALEAVKMSLNELQQMQ